MQSVSFSSFNFSYVERTAKLEIRLYHLTENSIFDLLACRSPR